MEIIRIPLYESNVPVPVAGQRDPNEPPIKYGIENMAASYAFAKLPDLNNIVVGSGTDLTAIGATASLVLTLYSGSSPTFWLNTTTNKYKFRLRATLFVAWAGTLDTLLAAYNCIVINTNIAATPYGGFLVLSIGKEGSGADLILRSRNIVNGKFLASINRASEEF